jgi:hypothetical protein
MPKCEQPRERIMDIAEHLIISKGVNRFGYNIIIFLQKIVLSHRRQNKD